MLYATDEINSDSDFNKAMVGVASVWYGASINSFIIELKRNTGMKETRMLTY